MKKLFAKRLGRLLTLLAASLCLTLVALAQSETAAMISGQVTDSTGAIITGASVTVTNKATGQQRAVVTNEDGLYVLTQLVPGGYDLTVEQSGFKKYIQTDVVLNVNDRRPIDIVLEAGLNTEVVTVTSEAPLLQDSPVGQALISGTQVVELPLNNRNFLKLTELAPGVSSSLDDESTFGLTSRADISINGLRRNSVNYLVDGVSNTDVGSNITLLSTPTVDSIQEFKILTSNYTAEIGRSGGGAVTLVTKGGGNEFHGSLYEFVRNDVTSANTYFNNRQGRRPDGTPRADVPKLRYHNFGGTLSGPVTLPRFGQGGRSTYSGRDKTFFFFSQETRRILRGAVDAAGIVPSLAQRGGNFSENLGAPLYRQSNGTSGTTVTATPLFVNDTAGNSVQARCRHGFQQRGASLRRKHCPGQSTQCAGAIVAPRFPAAEQHQQHVFVHARQLQQHAAGIASHRPQLQRQPSSLRSLHA